MSFFIIAASVIFLLTLFLMIWACLYVAGNYDDRQERLLNQWSHEMKKCEKCDKQKKPDKDKNCVKKDEQKNNQRVTFSDVTQARIIGPYKPW